MRLPHFNPGKQAETPQLPIEESKPRLVQLDSLVELAVDVWRLAKLWSQRQSSEGKEDASAMFLIEKIWHLFSETGLEIKDPTSQPFVEGMSLNVLAFDYPPEDVPKQRVVQETVSPAVFYQGEMIKMAQVIIGAQTQDGSNAKNNS